MTNTTISKAIKRSKTLTPQQSELKQLIQSKNFMAQVKNALPHGELTAKRYISACLTALSVTPKLLQCTTASVLKSMMESARYGLEPNSPLSEAALVTFGETCQFMIEYRGMMKLAWNTGLINSLDYDKVCENDHFVYTKGKRIKFEHTPDLRNDRGEVFAYYAIAELNNGGFALHVMSKNEILKHGAQFSRAFKQKSSPWQTDFDAMAYKTVIRQLCDKKLPKATTEQSVLMREAAHIDDFPEARLDDIPEADFDDVEEKVHGPNDPGDENDSLIKPVAEVVEKEKEVEDQTANTSATEVPYFDDEPGDKDPLTLEG